MRARSLDLPLEAIRKQAGVMNGHSYALEWSSCPLGGLWTGGGETENQSG